MINLTACFEIVETTKSKAGKNDDHETQTRQNSSTSFVVEITVPIFTAVILTLKTANRRADNMINHTKKKYMYIQKLLSTQHFKGVGHLSGKNFFFLKVQDKGTAILVYYSHYRSIDRTVSPFIC